MIVDTYDNYRRSLRVLSEEKSDSERYKAHFSALWDFRGVFPDRWEKYFDRLGSDFTEQVKRRNRGEK